MNVAEQLKGWKFNTTSFTTAARQFKEKGWTTKREFDDFMIEVLGKPVQTKGVKEAEIMCGYVIQEAVRMNAAGIAPLQDLVIEAATKKTAEYFAKNPWQKEPEIQIDENFVPSRTQRAPRNSGMSKKDRSVALYKENATKSRKELIELFVKELGLTPAGASTYVHNCQKGLWK